MKCIDTVMPIAALILIASPMTGAHCGASPLHEAEIVMPRPVEGKKGVWEGGRFFFAGQPDSVTFHWFAEQGVALVINIRTDQEMEKHNKEQFDEPALVGKLGMGYISIPVGGSAGYRPDMVYALAEALRANSGKALIHCRGAGRASYLWIAYLIKYRSVPVGEAMTIGEHINFSFLLEDLLGYSLSITSQQRSSIWHSRTARSR
jgi:uncharacterized protein (TIGR01244 family)